MWILLRRVIPRTTTWHAEARVNGIEICYSIRWCSVIKKTLFRSPDLFSPCRNVTVCVLKQKVCVCFGFRRVFPLHYILCSNCHELVSPRHFPSVICHCIQYIVCQSGFSVSNACETFFFCRFLLLVSVVKHWKSKRLAEILEGNFEFFIGKKGIQNNSNRK